jgi:hypothetical protein
MENTDIESKFTEWCEETTAANVLINSILPSGKAAVTDMLMLILLQPKNGYINLKRKLDMCKKQL